MEEMKMMLTMLGVIVVGVIAWVVYTNIRNNAAKNSKSGAKAADITIKKDMSSKYARCTFYMNNDYDNGYSQSEWMKLFKELVIDKEFDKDSEEYAAAVAPFVNAIVVEGKFYRRRGMQNMEHSLEEFDPGINDNISLNYFVEPYEYVKNKNSAAKHTQARTTASYDSAASDLRNAEKAYRDAVYNHKRFKGGSLETYYEIQEKKAYAALLSAQAKYDARK